MIELAPRSFGSVLCLGAHADDVEIGCGGTILQWSQQNPDLQFHWVVLAARGDRRAEAERSARAFLGSSKEPHVALHSFQDSFFPSNYAEIKQIFEELKAWTDIRITVWFPSSRGTPSETT